MVLLHRVRIYGLSLLLVAVVTVCALPFRGSLTLANFTIAYLLLVLLIAIRGGTGPAFVSAFACFMCINFFLVNPVYSLSVADPRELLDLLVFLLVAVIAGRLGAYAREQTQEARQRATEQEILYHLTRSFIQQTTKEGIFQALTGVLREDLSAREAHVLPFASEKSTQDNNTTHYLLLQGGERIFGTLRVVFDTSPTKPQIRLLNSCASSAALALQRIDLSELARKSQEFEEADKLKTAILHAVSHDLRTPITIIKTSAGNLRRWHDQLSAEERIAVTETIETEVDQLNKLVENLLDMSRLKAGALTLNCELNSLEEVAGDVAARMWQLTKQERIRIAFPEDMPLVSFDYGLMLQAVTNIVDNSLRYEPPESQVEIRGQAERDGIVLKIVNHGATISAEVKEHIMEPFYHGNEGRTGLGLPIAKGIVEAHQGQLWVENTPGGGATFVIILPATVEQRNETEDTGRR